MSLLPSNQHTNMLLSWQLAFLMCANSGYKWYTINSKTQCSRLQTTPSLCLLSAYCTLIITTVPLFLWILFQTELAYNPYIIVLLWFLVTSYLRTQNILYSKTNTWLLFTFLWKHFMFSSPKTKQKCPGVATVARSLTFPFIVTLELKHRSTQCIHSQI